VRVLIVEDEMLVAMALKLNLEACGHEIIGISSTEQMFWQFVEGEPDLIFLDTQLKDETTGIELARKFRQENTKTPIIFTVESEREVKLLEVSNSSILMKPVFFESLEEHLKQAL